MTTQVVVGFALQGASLSEIRSNARDLLAVLAPGVTFDVAIGLSPAFPDRVGFLWDGDVTATVAL